MYGIKLVELLSTRLLQVYNSAPTFCKSFSTSVSLKAASSSLLYGGSSSLGSHGICSSGRQQQLGVAWDLRQRQAAGKALKSPPGGMEGPRTQSWRRRQRLLQGVCCGGPFDRQPNAMLGDRAGTQPRQQQLMVTGELSGSNRARRAAAVLDGQETSSAHGSGSGRRAATAADKVWCRRLQTLPPASHPVAPDVSTQQHAPRAGRCGSGCCT